MLNVSLNALVTKVGKLWKCTYTVEGQLNVPCIQSSGPLVWADDRSKVFKVGVDFYQETFVLWHKQHVRKETEDD